MFKVAVPEPPIMVVVLRLASSGSPTTLSVTLSVNPFFADTVTVDVSQLPGEMVVSFAEAEIVKSGAVTVTSTVTSWTMQLLAASTTTE